MLNILFPDPILQGEGVGGLRDWRIYRYNPNAQSAHVRRGVFFVENNRSTRHMLILNTININHVDFQCFIEKPRLKWDVHDFRFWAPPGQAPEPETATTYASYWRFTIHSCRKAFRFRATARFRRMRISPVPAGSDQKALENAMKQDCLGH